MHVPVLFCRSLAICLAAWLAVVEHGGRVVVSAHSLAAAGEQSGAAPATPHMLLVAVPLCIALAVACGVTGQWGFLGHSVPRARAGRRQHVTLVKLAGEEVAVELAGLMHNHARRLTKDRNRAAKLAAHAYLGEDMADPEIVELISRSVCMDLRRIMSTCEKVFVVAEGNFVGKRHESARRRAAAGVAVAKKDWKQATAVTDCMTKRVSEWVKAQPNAEWVEPPGEGESQIMHMLQAKAVGFGLVFSGDSDVSIYRAGHGVVVNNIDIQGSVGGRKRNGMGGVQVWGKQIEMGEMWRAANGGGSDLSEWAMEDKAIFAAIIGCDYNEIAGGVPGKGHASALKEVTALRSTRGPCMPQTPQNWRRMLY
jgi:hypothetical protein